MDKIVGEARKETTAHLAKRLTDIDSNSMEFDQQVLDKARSILQPIHVSDSLTLFEDKRNDYTPNLSILSRNDAASCEKVFNPEENELTITGSRSGEDNYSYASQCPSITLPNSLTPVETITNDVEIKKEEAAHHVKPLRKSKRFTADEDGNLKMGIEKYGVGAWSFILHDKSLKFNSNRSRDSLRMRAETCGFKTQKKK